MPRGIPNVKRDDTAGMRFSSFHVPLPVNPKHITSSYLKSEGQTIWSRNNARSRPPEEQPGRKGSNVIVIHPGSRWLRIGRASDSSPAWVPNVIARRHNQPVPQPHVIQRISRLQEEPKSEADEDAEAAGGDEYAVTVSSDDPTEQKIAAISVSLRDRMRFYKLRVTPNAANIARRFNESFQPTYIREQSSRWIREPPKKDFITGDKVLRLADPSAMGFEVRWPIYARNFNVREGMSRQSVLDDVEAILRAALKEQFQIDSTAYRDYSIVLVIPDFYDKFYVRSLCDILLLKMGFGRLCAQQESLAATYGAGLSTACVIDIGATATSIACVDEGMVVADTRMVLGMGGDDITEFLYVLLKRIGFPYRSIDLAQTYDWNVLEDLKTRLCTLAEGDVALNLYEFLVRTPTQDTAKYGLRAYDEIIIAPMSFFEPRVIEFEKKRQNLAPPLEATEEIVENPSDEVTMAMTISTSHLQAALVMPPPDQLTPGEWSQGQQPPAEGINGHDPSLDEPMVIDDSTPLPTVPKEEDQASAPPEALAPPPTPSVLQSLGIPPDPSHPPPPPSDLFLDPQHLQQDQPWEPPFPEPLLPALDSVLQPPPPPTLPVPSIDILFEASKLPLDVAIFNSARGAGGDDKIRKYLQAVLVVGGSACVPGMAHALESRLQAIATPLVPNMEKVQIIPSPKDVDPHNLVWKGASVLAKLDGVADLWVTDEEWSVFGMRGLKERCYYL